MILPLEKKLKDLGCEIRTNAIVRHVTVTGGKVKRICVKDNEVIKDVEVDNLILAVPPVRLAQLVMSAETDEPQYRASSRATKAAPGGDPIVSVLPHFRSFVVSAASQFQYTTLPSSAGLRTFPITTSRCLVLCLR